MMALKVSLAGIALSKADALELINRMNANWPGKYWLEWYDVQYSNGAYNPLFRSDGYQTQAANPLMV